MSERPIEQPEIDYLSRDFESFRRLMLDQLGLVVPEVLEQDLADEGQAVVDVLAYVADHLAYYQDAIASEAYLGTARLRRSVRRHTRLLGYPLHEGCNARTWIHVTVAEPAAATQKVLLPAGTQLFTASPSAPQRIMPHTSIHQQLLASDSPAFETLHAKTLYAAHNEIRFFTPNASEQPQLPAGATKACFENKPDGQQHELQLTAGDVVIFEELRSPDTGRCEDANRLRRHAVRLTEVWREQYRGSLLVVARWQSADALPFPLYIAPFRGDIQRPISVARGNIILADHGKTMFDQSGRRVEEQLPQVPAFGRYRPRLRSTNLTQRVVFDQHKALSQPAQETLKQDPHAALPDIHLVELGPMIEILNPKTPGIHDERKYASLFERQLADHGLAKDPTPDWQPLGRKIWTLRAELLNSEQLARDFVAEVENDGRVYLRFGMVGLGRRPTPGSRFVARYRIGSGLDGNLGADAIAHVATSQDGIISVRNPLPAVGGQERERLEAARLHAPHILHRRESCVTAEDYATIACTFPGVANAVARLRWSGSQYTHALYIQRVAGLVTDSAFKDHLLDFLEPYRLMGYDITIYSPHYVPLELRLQVCVQPSYQRQIVERSLRYALGTSQLAEGNLGFFHPSRWTFGQPVYESQVIAAAMQVPGVAAIKNILFQRADGRVDGAGARVSHISIGELEIAQLDNHSTAPGSGIFSLDLQGGLSA